MKTDIQTEVMILSQVTKKLLAEKDVNPEEYLKSEFSEALTAKYHAQRYPLMKPTLIHK